MFSEILSLVSAMITIMQAVMAFCRFVIGKFRKWKAGDACAKKESRS